MDIHIFLLFPRDNERTVRDNDRTAIAKEDREVSEEY